MKKTILHALPQHAAVMDASVQAAIEAYCTPENIDAVISKATREALDMAVKEEVRDFFRSSNSGRQAVREAVILYLSNWDNKWRDVAEKLIKK